MEKASLTILFVWVASCFFVGDELHAQDYPVLPYASYTSETSSGRMAMDNEGNLYVAHYNDGKIVRVDPSGQDEVFVSGLENLYDIAWGGGTPYGNSLFVTSPSLASERDRLYRIDQSGNIYFVELISPNHGPCAIGFDRYGNYGNQLYIGTGSQDRIINISFEGFVSTFSLWPGAMDGGGVYGLSVDPSGKYGNMMYLANSFQPQNAELSGLFAINPNTTTWRFADALVSAIDVDFDAVGVYFDHDMFVLGRDAYDAGHALWRVFADGSTELFMTDVRSFTFGDDGAMYVSRYDAGSQTVVISQIIPEPATLVLLAAGGGVLLRRRCA